MIHGGASALDALIGLARCFGTDRWRGMSGHRVGSLWGEADYFSGKAEALPDAGCGKVGSADGVGDAGKRCGVGVDHEQRFVAWLEFGFEGE